MSLRIAIVKPDWGITGGFELFMGELAQRLARADHHVEWASPKVAELDPRPFGLGIDNVMAHEPEFGRYVQLIAEFQKLDLHRADLVISSQPPSFAIEHPRHICVFSHHLRYYYDLSDALIESGMVAGTQSHRHAAALVRQIDARYLPPISRILATSEEIKRRLAEFNGLHDVGVIHGGPGFASGFPQPHSTDSFEQVLCVSRHEFPKRTELFVQAMNLVPQAQAVSVGLGGRLGAVMELDRRFATGALDRDVDSTPLWRTNTPFVPVTQVPDRPGAVEFVGFASTEELDARYRAALCVIAPAYLEDYGLTAVEAMAYGKPLIVCRDGGNLVNFIEDGVHGFVVEPTAAAIAEATQRFVDDPELARTMGANARELARSYTWERATDELNEAIELVMAE